MQPQNPVRHKVYRISPLKCRDLAALLEFEIVWDYAGKQPAGAPPPSPAPLDMGSLPAPSGMLGGGGGVSLAGLPPTSTLLGAKQQRYPDTSSSISSRRTTASMSSQSSDRDPLADLAGCSDCRSAKRRLERKEMQILQLESFLKESQKRIDSLVFENEELLVREHAETANAGRYRAITSRLLQELEMAFQFCATQVMQAQESGADMATSFMFLPQFEFMERVKRFHFELDALAGVEADDPAALVAGGVASAEEAWKLFDFSVEMQTALERNQQLQRQLEFVGRSLLYEGQDGSSSAPVKPGMAQPRLHRTGTNTSADTSGGESDNSLDDSLARSHGAAPVLTMTEQINSLERENFLLKAKLEGALEDLKLFQKTSPLHSVAAADTRSSISHGSISHGDDGLQVELENIQEAKSLLEQEKETLEQDKVVLEQELDGARAEIDKLQRLLEDNKLSSSSSGPAAPPAYPSGSPSLTGSSGGESDANAAAAPGFLNKIYMDVGKAKIALEEKVKQLNVLLREATDENLRLQAKVEAQEEELARKEEDSEPKIVELSDDGDRLKIAALEKQIGTLQSALDDATRQLAVKERELASLRDHVDSSKAIGSAKQETEKELESVLGTLMKAQDRTTELEKQVQLLQKQLKAAEEKATPPPSVPSSPSSLVVNGGGDRGDEIAELTKQLKLSKQEVMQLRYRSNQMESVNERLEEALKEKRTLEVKLTALEGQLYDHRSRTISDNSFATDQNAMVAELQKQLDQRSAQLDISQRELELMKRELTTRSASGSVALASASGGAADMDDLSAKVKRFEGEILRLCDRNDEQARKLDALGERIALVTRERAELEGICRQMVHELDAMSGGGAAYAEGDEAGEAAAGFEEKLPAPVSIKVSDRYETALVSNDRVASSAARVGGGGGGGGKVAHLIKNFSAEDSPDAAAAAAAPAVRRFSKVDFRLRNGSNASTGSSVEAMAARFQAGIAN